MPQVLQIDEAKALTAFAAGSMRPGGCDALNRSMSVGVLLDGADPFQ
jgi:hypothetical protein